MNTPQTPDSNNAPAEPSEAGSVQRTGSPAFVVEAMVVNLKERRCGWKEIARYEDRETAEHVRKLNRRRGQFRVREEMPENAEVSDSGPSSGAVARKKPL